MIVKCSMRGKECTVNRKVRPLGSSRSVLFTTTSGQAAALVCWYYHCLMYLFSPPADYELPKWRKCTLFILLSLEPNTVPGNTRSVSICENEYTGRCGHGKSHRRNETGWMGTIRTQKWRNYPIFFNFQLPDIVFFFFFGPNLEGAVINTCCFLRK